MHDIKRFVLVFPTRDKEICLPIKKEKIGAGKRNGYGGKIKCRESVTDAIAREVREEAKVAIDKHKLTFIATCEFLNNQADGSQILCVVEVYTYEVTDEVFVETPEMGPPEWFPKHRLPLHELMPADMYWLPLALKGGPLLVKAEYTENQKEIVGQVHYKALAA
jgi:8-oxo-dGTP diphosphatase